MVRTTTDWRSIVGIAIAVVLSSGGSSLLAQRNAASTDEDAVRAMETKRGEALLKADTSALSSMMTDEFVEISRFGQVRTKADNMRDIASGDLKLLTVKYEDTTVRLYGEVAVLTAVADNTGTFRGNPFSGKIRYTRIFVRRDRGWQAVLMQQTVMP